MGLQIAICALVAKLLNLIFEFLDHFRVNKRLFGTGRMSASVVQIRQWRKHLRIVSDVTSMVQATTAICMSSITPIFLDLLP